jgi:hypothetical protein
MSRSARRYRVEGGGFQGAGLRRVNDFDVTICYPVDAAFQASIGVSVPDRFSGNQSDTRPDSAGLCGTKSRTDGALVFWVLLTKTERNYEVF